jgi:DNA replication protein DnaC
MLYYNDINKKEKEDSFMVNTMVPNAALLDSLCQSLQLSVIRKEALVLADEAYRHQKPHLDFLVTLLEDEWQAKLHKRSQRRMKAAGFPWLKTLESFQFSKTSDIPESLIRKLATNDYIEKAQPIILLGEPGTGKTHLAIALGITAATQGFNVRFITAAELANQLMEAKDSRNLSSVIKRYSACDLLILDELGYLPLSKADAELLFQVLSKRQEHKPVIVTTNLPFSEWLNVFPDPRLCKAVIDRLTYQAHIIETGETSIRLAESIKGTKELAIKNTQKQK